MEADREPRHRQAVHRDPAEERRLRDRGELRAASGERAGHGVGRGRARPQAERLELARVRSLDASPRPHHRDAPELERPRPRVERGLGDGERVEPQELAAAFVGEDEPRDLARQLDLPRLERLARGLDVTGEVAVDQRALEPGAREVPAPERRP